MQTIIFDESCVGWSEIPERTAAFLRLQKDYLENLLVHRGYLYRNTIYEILGARWDPNDKNICYLAEFGPISIDFKSAGDGTYLITIP